MHRHSGIQTSTSRRRLHSGAPSPRWYDTFAIVTGVTGAGLLGVLIVGGLALTPVLAQQRSDPEQDLFPANLVLELTDDHIPGDGGQIVVTPLSHSREIIDDLLFVEPAGQSELGYHQQMEARDRPKNVPPRPQSWMDANQRKKLNQ